MTKREMTRFANRIKRMEAKLAKKRDEIRTVLGDMESLVESFNESDERLHTVFNNLQSARLELEGATDSMSQFV